MAAEGTLMSAGGRVVNVVGLGPQLDDARAIAYRAAEAIQFTGKHFRRDIGARGRARRPAGGGAARAVPAEEARR